MLSLTRTMSAGAYAVTGSDTFLSPTRIVMGPLTAGFAMVFMASSRPAESTAGSTTAVGTLTGSSLTR